MVGEKLPLPETLLVVEFIYQIPETVPGPVWKAYNLKA
jgi:hypothetical protein